MIEPYERLLPFLNRSRTVQQHSTLAYVLTPARHFSTSEQSVPSTNFITEPLSSSDSNLFRRHTTTTTISSAPTNNFSTKKTEDKINEERFPYFSRSSFELASTSINCFLSSCKALSNELKEFSRANLI